MKTRNSTARGGKELAKRLGAYSAAAAAVASQGTANAAEVVHDIPDVTAGNYPGLLFNLITGSTALAAASTGNIGDGLFRMASYNAFPYIAGPASSTMAGFVGPGGFGTADFHPTRLVLGDRVGPRKNFGADIVPLVYGPYGYLNVNFANTRGFVGLRFSIGGSLHYGWAEVTNLGAGQGTILHSFGYNNTPGAASVPSVIPKKFALRIAPNPDPMNAGHYDFEWDSEDGKVYDLVSATDLSTAPAGWPVWSGRANIASEGTITTLDPVPGGDDPNRFFAVIEKDPPLLNGSFEKPGAPSGQILPADDWDVHNPAGVPISAGDVATYEPGDAPPPGEWVGSVYAPAAAAADYGFSQVLGETFAADTDYGVSMQLRDGSLAGASGAPYKIQLVSGTTILAEDDNSVALTTAWAPRTISYTGTPVSGPVPAPGDPLELRILIKAGATTDHAVDCDQVTFTATETSP